MQSVHVTTRGSRDGLAQTWEGVCWMNPPYGRQIGKWMQKAYQAAIGGRRSFVSCLLEQTRNGGMNTRCAAKLSF